MSYSILLSLNYVTCFLQYTSGLVLRILNCGCRLFYKKPVSISSYLDLEPQNAWVPNVMSWNSAGARDPLHNEVYSKVSIKLPVLLNILFWNFLKSTISEKIYRTFLFMYLLTVSIKHPGLDFLKKSLLNNQYYLFFTNSRSLEPPGLIIETLEYWALV